MNKLKLTRLSTFVLAGLIITTTQLALSISKSDLIDSIKKTYLKTFITGQDIRGKKTEINVIEQQYVTDAEGKALLNKAKAANTLTPPFILITPWNKISDEMYNFVKAKAKDNKELQNAAFKALSLGTELVNNIKLTRSLYSGKGATSASDFKAVNEKSESIKKELEQLAKRVKDIKVKKSGIFFGSSEEEAQSVLVAFIAEIKDLPTKIKYDVQDILRAVPAPKDAPAPAKKK